VTFLELFFDLAFVFALFQLSHLLLRLSWSGALQTLVLYLASLQRWFGWRHSPSPSVSRRRPTGQQGLRRQSANCARTIPE
jgi:hypothetical protein